MSDGAQSLEQAAQSLRALFPDLEMNHISLLGKGWDSAAYLVNGRIVVRVPRRPAVGQQMGKEVRVLETIRPYVSLRIPFIEWFGQPQGASLFQPSDTESCRVRRFRRLNRDQRETMRFDRLANFSETFTPSQRVC